MPIAAAVPAIISGGASIAGGLLGGGSSNKAGKQQAAADAAASRAIGTATNQAMDQENQVLSPYINAGTDATNRLSAAFQPGGDLAKQFSFDPSQIQNNPNYQFVLQQGTDAVQKSAAAKGGLFSGGTMKALDQYSQGLATQTINDAYSQALNTFQTNHNNMFQGLSTLSSIGQQGTAQLGNALGRFQSGQIASADAYRGVGDAQANATLSSGNAWQNALGGLTGPLINLAGNLPKSPDFNSVPLGQGVPGVGTYGPPVPSGYGWGGDI